MSSTAQVRVTLRDFMSVPTNFDIKSSEFKSNYKFKIGEEELSWQPLGYIIKEEVSNKQNPVKHIAILSA